MNSIFYNYVERKKFKLYHLRQSINSTFSFSASRNAFATAEQAATDVCHSQAKLEILHKFMQF
jgi:hypothetical protein